ncbi:MAG: hypothetical protein AAF485_31490 [Chloroflexota bacterium]
MEVCVILHVMLVRIRRRGGGEQGATWEAGIGDGSVDSAVLEEVFEGEQRITEGREKGRSEKDAQIAQLKQRTAPHVTSLDDTLLYKEC